MSGDYPNYSIIGNGQSTEKSPGDLRRHPATQTPVKYHQLTLMKKTLKEKIIMINREHSSKAWKRVWRHRTDSKQLYQEYMKDLLWH